MATATEGTGVSSTRKSADKPPAPRRRNPGQGYANNKESLETLLANGDFTAFLTSDVGKAMVNAVVVDRTSAANTEMQTKINEMQKKLDANSVDASGSAKLAIIISQTPDILRKLGHFKEAAAFEGKPYEEGMMQTAKEWWNTTLTWKNVAITGVVLTAAIYCYNKLADGNGWIRIGNFFPAPPMQTISGPTTLDEALAAGGRRRG